MSLDLNTYSLRSLLTYLTDEPFERPATLPATLAATLVVQACKYAVEDTLTYLALSYLVA